MPELEKEKPALNTSDYAFRNYLSSQASIPKNFSLTELQRDLFFIFENGIFRMQELSKQQANMVTLTCTRQAAANKMLLSVTTFVSVGIVTFILILTFPLISNIFTRELMIVRFIEYLKKETIDRIIQEGVKYQQDLVIYQSDNSHEEVTILQEVQSFGIKNVTLKKAESNAEDDKSAFEV